MKKVIPCGVALIRDGSRFLIAQRRPEDTFGLFWEFPGGKKDPGESFEACVAREAMEELGIEVRPEKKFMEIRKVYDGRVIRLNFYLCSFVSGKPRPLDCQDVRWADLSELGDFRFPPANGRVIQKLRRQFLLKERPKEKKRDPQ